MYRFIRNKKTKNQINYKSIKHFDEKGNKLIKYSIKYYGKNIFSIKKF